MPRKRIKSELDQEIERARTAGKFMVAIWTIEDEKLNLYRMTENFPVIEFIQSIKLLNDNLLQNQTNSIN